MPKTILGGRGRGGGLDRNYELCLQKMKETLSSEWISPWTSETGNCTESNLLHGDVDTMAMEGATRLIADTRTNLVCRRGEAKQLNVVFGFDAFIDQIADMVDKRQDFQNYEKLSTIQAFGEKISGAAGLSTSIEYVPRYVKTGGSAVTTGLAKAKAGCMVTYIGCIGYPEVNPVFEEFAQAMTGFYTVGNPGQTIAAEFQDGKMQHIAPTGNYLGAHCGGGWAGYA